MNAYETERLLLRPFCEEDIPAVHAYAGSPENLTFLLWGPNSLEETRRFVRMAAKKGGPPGKEIHLAVLLKEGGALIGACSLAAEQGAGELGWILHRDYWRQGYGTELGRFLLKLGFEACGLRRLFARCDAENTGSYRLMERLGMRREGCFRRSRRSNGLAGTLWRDEYVYGILREEWERHAPRAGGCSQPEEAMERLLLYREMFRFVENHLRACGGEECPYAPFRRRSAHIRRVCGWAWRLAKAYPGRVDIDSLIIAALFHDAGYDGRDRRIGHALLGAQVFEEYAGQAGLPDAQRAFVRDLVARHSEKGLMLEKDTPPELLLLMEADLLDETGAMSLTWDALAEGAQPEGGFESACRRMNRYSARILSENPMVTQAARSLWQQKQELTAGFLHSLKSDLMQTLPEGFWEDADKV
ncbi:MAG: GNAT family N-acetyltransferase [Provencibacterium sp.]|jgi:RimJ/RimL family protein N-acetyltransferase/HD superfamily phosphodiesterase|nr:GNAT family N-acetyltransferase [Provencibacterium sp.]